MDLRHTPVLYIDCQTTGATPKQGSLLEVGWAVARATDESLCESRITTRLVRPAEDTALPPRIRQMTGIRDEEMETAVDEATVFRELADVDAGRAVIHFASFERRFLRALWKTQSGDGDVPWDVWCSHKLAGRLFANLPSRSLRALAGYFGESLGPEKRSLRHVQATHVIWSHLAGELARSHGVQSWKDLEDWLEVAPRRVGSGPGVPLRREERLALEDRPGIYRMHNRRDEVLYVGKATSLKSRVNSYFQGRRNLSGRKKEMVTQVYRVSTESCATSLEAALWEADEIKRLEPPYNVALRRGERAVTYVSRDFRSWSPQRDKHHPLGPFLRPDVFAALTMVADGTGGGGFDEQIFSGQVPEDTIAAGWRVVCERAEDPVRPDATVRALVARGVWVARSRELPQEEGDDPPGREAVRHPEGVDEDVDEDEDDDEGEAEAEAEELTAEEAAKKLERLFVKGAACYLRSREMTCLADATVFWRYGAQPWRYLGLHQGQVKTSGRLTEPLTEERAASCCPLEAEDAKLEPSISAPSVEEYDRLRVLGTEIRRILWEGACVALHTRDGLWEVTAARAALRFRPWRGANRAAGDIRSRNVNV